MTKLFVALLAMAPLFAAGVPDTTDWQNLRNVASGQQIDVVKSGGDSLKGAFVRFDDASLTLDTNRGSVSVPKAEVRRVRPRGHRTRNTWIGAGIGAGAGAGIGAGIGESLAHTSGGDFANLKPAIAGACAVVGAAVGAVLGSVLTGRHSDIYRAK